jgi:adenylate kinase family enzyme
LGDIRLQRRLGCVDGLWMVAVLLAGGPGAGKSTVASALRDRGLCSVDLDHGFARHEDADGNSVPFPAEPDLVWLTTHHWRWVDDRLTELLSQYRSRNALLCGTAFNMFDHLDRFALVILLRLDARTLEARLQDPNRDNIFGKVGATATWSHWWRTEVETELTKRHARTVDARRPLRQVVDEVLLHCADAGYPIAGGTHSPT